MLSLGKCFCGIGTKMSPNFTIGKVMLSCQIKCIVSLRNINIYYVVEFAIKIQTTIHLSSTTHPQYTNVIKFKCKYNIIVVIINFLRKTLKPIIFEMDKDYLTFFVKSCSNVYQKYILVNCINII